MKKQVSLHPSRVEGAYPALVEVPLSHENCYSKGMNALERQYQRYYQRQRLRQRQKARQRQLLLGLFAVVLLLVGVWSGFHAVPKHRWLEIPDGFYRPEMAFSSVPLAEDALTPLPFGMPDRALQQKIQAVLARYPSTFIPHVFYINLADGAYVDMSGQRAVPAASVVKLPILLAYFRELDRGRLTPYTYLLYENFEQAAGSGTLQYRLPGQPLLAKDVAAMMIQSSDNTCTNMLIYHLGGAEAMNQTFETLGLTRTHIRNWLPDLGGTNMISMVDMATVLYNLTTGDTLSAESQQAALEILKGTHNRRLIPALLPKEAVVAHKTGDIGTSLGNAGLVMLPNGQRYILAIQVERPFNDYGAKDMIQQVSKAIYDDVASRPMLAQTPHTKTR